MRRLMKLFLFMLYLFATTSFLFFSIFELFPGLLDFINLQRVPYYYVKREFKEDPSLIFVPRSEKRVVEIKEFRGEKYSSAFGVNVPPIEYRATYDRNGFRKGSSIPPIDILILGDSFMDVGESDNSTFAEILKQTSGLSTLNLGRESYGPQHYLEVLKRYGLTTKAKYVLFCFFDGNDIDNIAEYIKWQRGDGYYHFVFSDKNVLEKYMIVVNEVSSLLWTWLKEYFSNVPRIHPKLALIQLNARIVSMTFAYWNRDVTADVLLRTEEWKTLVNVLTEFQALAIKNDMKPIVLFIPTKVEVYGSLVSDRSGEQVLRQINKQLQFETNSLEALQTVAKDVRIELVDLLPYFKKLAKEGKELYYPFDTHWNITGREAAAEFLTAVITTGEVKE